MATTTGGSTYVTSTDLVANYPTASLALANRVDVVASGSMSKKTASYTVTVADILAGTTIAMNSASATVITLPSTSLVNGMMLNVFSVNTGAVTFTGGTVTGSVTSISSQYSGVSLTYDSAAAVWWCLPFGGSAGTTGSQIFTSNGTFTVPAGITRITYCVVGGGGGAYNGSDGAAGGGGGGVNIVDLNVTPGQTITATIGAGGATASAGGTTTFGSTTAGGGAASTSGGAGAGGTGGGRGGTGGAGGTAGGGTGNNGPITEFGYLGGGGAGGQTATGNKQLGGFGGGGEGGGVVGYVTSAAAGQGARGMGGGGGGRGTSTGQPGGSGCVIIRY